MFERCAEAVFGQIPETRPPSGPSGRLLEPPGELWKGPGQALPGGLQGSLRSFQAYSGRGLGRPPQRAQAFRSSPPGLPPCELRAYLATLWKRLGHAFSNSRGFQRPSRVFQGGRLWRGLEGPGQVSARKLQGVFGSFQLKTHQKRLGRVFSEGVPSFSRAATMRASGLSRQAVETSWPRFFQLQGFQRPPQPSRFFRVVRDRLPEPLGGLWKGPGQASSKKAPLPAGFL